jgi:hypothetical protein
MADTDIVARYTPNDYPQIKGGEHLFLMEELRKLQSTIATVIEVLELLEARIVVLEP